MGDASSVEDPVLEKGRTHRVCKGEKLNEGESKRKAELNIIQLI